MTEVPHQPNLSNQLQVLWRSLVNSGQLIYVNHTVQIKILLLIVIAYVAFKVGRATVTDTIDNQIKDVSNVLKYRQHYTIYLPQKVKRIAKTRLIIFVIVLLVSLASGILYYLQHSLINQRTLQQLQAGGILIIIVLLIVVGMWCYEKILSLIMKKGGYNDILIHQKLSAIVTSLGKKTQYLLKSYLCRQKFRTHKNPPVGLCVKEKCKNQRQLLKERFELYSKMVDSVLHFQWCSICRKRAPFDEQLLHQSSHYEKNQDISEEEEVKEKNRYLLKELERMCQWVERINPCNCSKRYWLESTKEIIQFKRQDKIISQELSKHGIQSPQKK